MASPAMCGCSRTPAWSAIGIFVLELGLLAAWRIHESARAAAVAALLEIGGLLLVVALSADGLATLPGRLHEFAPPAHAQAWQGCSSPPPSRVLRLHRVRGHGQVAEEAVDPARMLPRAILLALAVATLLHLLVALAAVLTLSRDELAATLAPLGVMYAKSTGREPVSISIVALFAVANGRGAADVPAFLAGARHQGWNA